ncbi:hypothetical protein [Brevibacillus daliensis]|uniref:hypothetical protein n=1 Tax=Brevibacillus daliensis TaxID=2892995 RepID=UPI001E622657|nr:hypothetical protein [Brevibacillus daliensis]
MNREEPICIEMRFDLIRKIISDYQALLKHMETEVVELFATNQLEAISICLEEKKRVEVVIIKLQHFVDKWEARSEMGIDY